MRAGRSPKTLPNMTKGVDITKLRYTNELGVLKSSVRRVIHKPLLPAPSKVIEAGIDFWGRSQLGTYIAISTQRVIIGAIRAVPSLAWVPLLLLRIGIGEDSKVTLVAIGAFFPVYTTVSAALSHVDPKLVEAARSFGIRGLNLFTTVQLPAVLPSVVSGLRLALAQAWLFLVAAELLGASMGLGFLLTDSQNNGRTDRLLLAIVLLAILGKITDALLGVLSAGSRPGFPATKLDTLNDKEPYPTHGWGSCLSLPVLLDSLARRWGRFTESLADTGIAVQATAYAPVTWGVYISM